MGWQFPLYVFVLLAATFISALMTLLILKYRDRTCARPLLILFISIGWWSLMSAISLASTSFLIKQATYQLIYVGAVGVPVGWFIFTIEYTGRSSILTRERILLILVIPVLTIALAATRPEHTLLWTDLRMSTIGSIGYLHVEYGVWFYIHLGYSYLLIAIGTALIVRMLLRAENIYFGQAFALLLAVLIPWISNVSNILSLTPPYLDPTNLGFLVGSLILFGAVYRDRLFDVLPVAREVARDEIIQTSPDPIIVIDDHRRIIDVNPAAESICSNGEGGIIGHPLDDIFSDIADALEELPSSETVRADVHIESDEEVDSAYYDMYVTPLRLSYNVIAGHMLSLRDVTERHRHERQLAVLHRLLRHNVRNDMNVVDGRIEMVKNSVVNPELETELATAREKALELVTKTEKFRAVIDTITADHSQTPINPILEQIVEDYRMTYSQATIRLDSSDDITVGAPPTIKRAFLELLENAIQHTESSSPEVTISLRQDLETNSAIVRFADRGPGIPPQERGPFEGTIETQLDHSSGVGLWAAAWIVRTSDGCIDLVEANDETVIEIRLPLLSS